MSLGTNISRLRAEKRLSQGELADILNVSRQSVSKWETDGSVPDLDKLVKLSRVFDVTLDELVTGEAPAAPSAESSGAEAAPAIVPRGLPGRKIAGIILLCMAFLTFLLCTAVGGLLTGLFLCIPFVVCGVICFAAKKSAGTLVRLGGVSDIGAVCPLGHRPYLAADPAHALFHAGAELHTPPDRLGPADRHAGDVRGDAPLLPPYPFPHESAESSSAGRRLGGAGGTLRSEKSGGTGQMMQIPNLNIDLGFRFLLRCIDLTFLAVFAALLTITFCAARSRKKSIPGGAELPHHVRTVQKRPLVGKIKF